jgi:hypothetical protein
MSPLTNLPKMSMFFTSMHMRALRMRHSVGRHMNVLGHLSQNKQWGGKFSHMIIKNYLKHHENIDMSCV